MQVTITYIFHNCFTVRFADTALLFDYPGADYLNASIRETVAAATAAPNLYVFASHFHQDHFNREVIDLGKTAQRSGFIFSRDIVKRNRRFQDDPSCLTAAPDQTYRLDELEITTFRSNDEGVAFLIETAGWSLYFGGDLANWAWEDNNREERQLLEDYFGQVLQRLQTRFPARRPLSIAFSNTDARLRNWTGAAQFMETVQPRLFVPMHTFGQTETLTRFLAEHPQIATPVFRYQKTGDCITVET